MGSGAGGSVAAYVLARAGWEVVVLEKGVDHFGELGATKLGPPHFGSDEVKETIRNFSGADTFAEPLPGRLRPHVAALGRRSAVVADVARGRSRPQRQADPGAGVG